MTGSTLTPMFKYYPFNIFTAQKTIISFSKCSEKMIFPKKIALEYDLSCTIEKDDVSFPRKYDIILWAENER